MQYSYAYPHPAVTTDIVIFTIQHSRLEVLLIQRLKDPFKDCWALPGGFVDIDENLENAAMRELCEETGVRDVYLEQLFTFGETARDPRERVITVAYFAVVPNHLLKPIAGSDAAAVAWQPVDQLPALAFDHDRIIETARSRVSAKARYSTIACQFLPKEFTLSALQTVYEILLKEQLDKRNFRKWILSLNCIEATGAMRRNGQHRPARLYTPVEPGHVAFIR